jgi:YD repeat-containing protein
MADTTRTTTTRTGTTTQAGYDAEAVRVGAATPMDRRTHKDNSSTKGLVVGVLTFLVLSLWEWLDGATGAAGDAITFPEMLIYAIVGIVVGLIVKAIDKSRANKTRA